MARRWHLKRSGPRGHKGQRKRQPHEGYVPNDGAVTLRSVPPVDEPLTAIPDPSLQLLSFMGRGLVAASTIGSRPASAAAVRRLQTPSLKGTVAREVAVRFMMLGGNRLLPRTKLTNLWPAGPDDCIEWLHHLDWTRGRPKHMAVVWSQSRKETRLYVHLLNSSGHPVNFYKVLFGRESRIPYATEAATLSVLSQREFRSLSVPRLHQWFATPYSHTLAFDPLPERAVALRPSSRTYLEMVLHDLESTPTWYHLPDLVQLPWWNRAGRLADLVAEFLERTPNPKAFPCSFAHGDPSPANLLSSGDQLWLVDWEESGEAVPRGTDRLGTFLSFCSAATRRRRIRALRRQLRGIGIGQRRQRADLILALLYRHAHGHPEATAILSDWRTELGPL